MESFKLLTSVGNENEAELIKALLDTKEIPVLIKHRGNGSYLSIYMGLSYEGIDILVPEACIVEAQGLIGEKGQVVLQEALPEDQDYEVYREKYIEKKRNRMLILMIIINTPILITLIAKIFNK